VAEFLRRIALVAFLTFYASAAYADDVFIFTANWCGPCTALKRALAENPESLAPHNVAMFDIDANKDLARMYGIKTVPTILQFTPSGKIRRHTGFQGLSQLQQWLDRTATGVVRRLLRR
jgi:thioredoxin 1